MYPGSPFTPEKRACRALVSAPVADWPSIMPTLAIHQPNRKPTADEDLEALSAERETIIQALTRILTGSMHGRTAVFPSG